MGEKVFEQHVAMSGGKSETVFRLFSLQVATFMWVRAVRAQPLSPSEGPSPIIRTKPSLREKGGGGGSGTHSGYPFFPRGAGGVQEAAYPIDVVIIFLIAPAHAGPSPRVHHIQLQRHAGGPLRGRSRSATLPPSVLTCPSIGVLLHANARRPVQTRRGKRVENRHQLHPRIDGEQE